MYDYTSLFAHTQLNSTPKIFIPYFISKVTTSSRLFKYYQCLSRILPASSPDLLLLQELDAKYIMPAETDSEDEIIGPQSESILDISSSDHDEDLLSAMINNEVDVALQHLKQNDDTVLAWNADIELQKMQTILV